MPDDQFEPEEDLAASGAAFTDEDIPPDDEALSWPDPDSGMPPELFSLSGTELAELLEAPTVQHVPPAWPLSYRTSEAGGFVPGDGPETGTGFGEGGVLDELAAGIVLAGFADDAHGKLDELDDDSLIGVLRAWRRLASWATARELATVTELARRRPAPGTPPAVPGQLPHQLSEFIADEVGLALTLTGVAARTQLDLALDLHSRPAIAAALESGQIDLPKARILIAMICPLERAHADAVETAVLPRAPGLTTGELRAALLRAILAVDPDAARRRQETSQKDARVERWIEPEGTATLAGRYLPPAEVLAADKRLCTIAKSWKKQGAHGGMDLLRAHVYLALLLGQPIDTPPPGLLLPTETPVPTAEVRPTPARHRSPEPTEAPTPGQDGGPAPAGGGSPAAGIREPGQLLGGGTLRRPEEPVPGGRRQPFAGVPLPPLTGEVHLTIPMVTLLGLADRPGEEAGFGPLHAGTARRLADAMASNRRTRWGVIITNQDGRAMGWGGSARARPLSAGGWKITLTTEPIAPYP